MKKISVIFFAAIAMLTVASCAKEELVPGEAGFDNGKNITVSVTLSDDSKTSIADDGKTVTWVSGDSLLITDGSAKVAVYVPDEADGEKTASFIIDATKVDVTKPLYAVYPYMAYSKIDGGNIVVSIPSDQSGMFEEAHICVAKMSEDFNFAMKNVSAIFKIDVADNIQTLMISGGDKDTLAANLTVTYTDASTPVSVTETSPVKSIRLVPGTVGGAYYVAVAPGTYSADLSMMAITPDGQSEKVSATKTHTLAIGDIADLGRIGDSPAGAKFDGEGSEESPYLIKTQGDMTVLATAVNNGVDYAGVFFKVTDNISGVEIPVGTYDGVDFYFKGDFNGDGHTLTLAMGGEDSEESYLALFGELGEGAHIHNLIVAGSVKTTSDCVAGIASVANGGKEGILIENCTNKAVVEGNYEIGGIIAYGDGTLAVGNCSNEAAITGKGHYVGGVAGYLTGADVKVTNCTNKGAVSGTYSIGGIVGHVFASTIESCVNDAAAVITGTDTASDGFYKMNQGNSGWMWGNWSTAWAGGTPYNTNNSIRGIGGIAGYGQNAKFISDTNNGTVNGVDKVGGIVGGAYTASTTSCTNNGAVTASNSMAGGILGWAYTAHTANGDTNNGTITAKFCVGGLYGFLNCLGYSSSNATSAIKGARNTGAVIGTTPSRYVDCAVHTDASMAGGVFGCLAPAGRGNTTRGLFNVQDCSNSGTVTGAGFGVGGVVGRLLSKTYSLTNTFSNISNTGDVTGTNCVGGIIGDSYISNNGHYKTTMNNISNTGKVVATLEGDVNVFVGGIFGKQSYLSGGGNNTYGDQISNTFNTGEVTYATATNTKPYAGGIAGAYYLGQVYNAYNTGYVGPAGYEDPAADAASSLGSIFGFIGGGKAGAGYLYFDEGTAAAACGGESVSVSNVSMVDIKGLLLTLITFDGSEYDAVLNVLNAYATKNSLKSWTAGPAFN